MQFVRQDLSHHKDFASADFVTRQGNVVVEYIINDDLSSVEAHDEESILRDAFSFFRVCL